MGRGRSSPQLLSMKTLVLLPACTGVAGVAHSRAPRIGGNRGIMRKINSGSGHGSAPMCTDPPHCTWEPERRTQCSPEKPVIPTKNSPRSAEAPVSHVQHQKQPHPPDTPHPTQPTHPTPHHPDTTSDIENKHCLRCTDTPHSAPRSVRMRIGASGSGRRRSRRGRLRSRRRGRRRGRRRRRGG